MNSGLSDPNCWQAATLIKSRGFKSELRQSAIYVFTEVIWILSNSVINFVLIPVFHSILCDSQKIFAQTLKGTCHDMLRRRKTNEVIMKQTGTRMAMIEED